MEAAIIADSRGEPKCPQPGRASAAARDRLRFGAALGERTINKKLAAAALAAAFCAPAALAQDGLSVELGNGRATDLWRLGAQWNWKSRWFDHGNWTVGGYWDVSVGAWSGHSGAGGNTDLVDFGLTPVFRLQQRERSGLAPYLEGAIGFHLLSKTRINANRAFGSSFQFGDHVGIGVRFGSRHQYDLSLRYQHVSNADLKKPNNGIDFTQLRLQYHF